LPKGGVEVFSGDMAFLHFVVQRMVEKNFGDLFRGDMMLPDKLVENRR